MLRELVELAQILQKEEKLLPTGYKLFSEQSPIRWVLHIKDGRLLHLEESEIKNKGRPVRQRSGKASTKNVKPYLLVDEARFALGIPEPGREKETMLLHEGFKKLLDELYTETQDHDVEDIINYLNDKTSPSGFDAIEPRDVVTFMVEGKKDNPEYVFEKTPVNKFWEGYVAKEFTSEFKGTCGVCGKPAYLLQTLPMEVFVSGQKCQMSSFNKSAFESLGRTQTTNASLCFACGMKAAQALNYLFKEDAHHTVVVRNDAWGASASPLQTQVAVYWMKLEEKGGGDEHSDFIALLSRPLARETFEVKETLALLENFLKLPWSGKSAPLSMTGNNFYLAILSANKARLVLREWISVSIHILKEKLADYVSALSVVGSSGTSSKFFPIPVLLDAVKDSNPNTIRGLIKTAYLGYPPPPGLLESSVRRIRIPKDRGSWAIHPIISAMKLALTFGNKKEVIAMERLDSERNNPAYLSGRLLAVLEEIQQRSANWKLNTTLVDRFYGAASTSPATAFPVLIKLAETAHLPKLRKSQWGYQRMRGLLEEILSRLGDSGGFSSALPLKDQGWFALGFYHQRAALAAERKEKSESKDKGKKEETT